MARIEELQKAFNRSDISQCLRYRPFEELPAIDYFVTDDGTWYQYSISYNLSSLRSKDDFGKWAFSAPHDTEKTYRHEKVTEDYLIEELNNIFDNS
jgi:hypothetical protein